MQNAFKFRDDLLAFAVDGVGCFLLIGDGLKIRGRRGIVLFIVYIKTVPLLNFFWYFIVGPSSNEDVIFDEFGCVTIIAHID